MRHFCTALFFVSTQFALRAMTVDGIVQNPTCGLSNGCINAWATGGAPPYTYLWSPAPPGGQGMSNTCGLSAGTWSLTVTDSNADEVTHDFVLVDQTLGDVSFTALTYAYNQSAAHHPCIASSDGSFSVIQTQLGGTPPYTITADGMPPIGFDMFTNDPIFGYYSLNQNVYVSISDANGCQGWATVFMDGPSTAPFSAYNIDPSCGGQNNGSVDLSFGYSGPYGPYLSVIGPSGNIYSDTPFSEPLSLSGLEPGIYTVVRDYDPVYFASACQFIEQFTIPDLGVACGTVSGDVFIDNDQDCVQDPQEVGVPYRVIEINPGPQYAITNGSGHYTRNVSDGSYNLIAQGADLYPICPPVQPVPFTISGNAAIIDLADSSLVQLDVRVFASQGPARVGFVQSIWGEVRNLSAQLSGAITLTATFDPAMSFINASPTPTTVAGNVLTWSLPSFTSYAAQNFSIQLQVPADVGLIGQSFVHSFSVSQPIAESNTANNNHSLSGTITSAYDPNDKTAFTSSGWSNELYYIDQDEWIDYTVRFQNTGNDTAFTVVVTDTISPLLDLSTYEQGPASHPFTVEFKDGRVVEWRFAEILLPDSNVNEAASHGLLSFRVRPHLPLLPGTLLTNNADIYFDFNPPVRTNDAVLTAEMTTRVVELGHSGPLLYPNPGTDLLTIVSAGRFQASILDLTGRILRTVSSIADRATLDLSDMPRGTYLVRVTEADGTSSASPWTKQ